jgi:hypothetical protein
LGSEEFAIIALEEVAELTREDEEIGDLEIFEEV